MAAEGLWQAYDSVNLRKSNPNLYLAISTFALTSFALGANFLLTHPTFNPYDIPYWIIGVIFCAIGLTKLFFLNVRRSLRRVRAVMGVSIGFRIFWGIGTTLTFFQGKSSLQLFVLYSALTALEFLVMNEPFFNPMTATKDDGGERV